jgi:hypothetical protein
MAEGLNFSVCPLSIRWTQEPGPHSPHASEHHRGDRCDHASVKELSIVQAR